MKFPRATRQCSATLVRRPSWSKATAASRLWVLICIGAGRYWCAWRQMGSCWARPAFDNDPLAFAEQIALMGEAPEVVLEATYGWVRHEGA